MAGSFEDGFESGISHAMSTARDNPDFRAIACAIVEDWVRELGKQMKHEPGLDLSFRMLPGRARVAAWDHLGELAGSAQLHTTLAQLERDITDGRHATRFASPDGENDA
jgi:hypothetical protein